MDDHDPDGRAQLLFFSLAQKVWVMLRSLGWALVGRERFDRLVSAAGLREWKTRHWQSETTLPDGNRVIYRPHDQCFIDEIYSLRIYDQENAILPGQTVVDLGGHIGLFTLYASRKVGSRGRVVVCEPNPHNFALLKRNIGLNDLPHISAHHCAVAERDGEAEFYIPEGGADRDNPATSSLYSTQGRRAVKVPLRTLDGLMREEGIESIDHLKVDVEGAELDVLKGGEHCLKNTRRIVMEVHPPRVDPGALYAYLEERGFQIKELSKDPLIVEGRRAP